MSRGEGMIGERPPVADADELRLLGAATVEESMLGETMALYFSKNGNERALEEADDALE